jgi:hypothetical protein
MYVNERMRGACVGLEEMRVRMEKSRAWRKMVRFAREERRPMRDRGREMRQKVLRSVEVERWEWIRDQISEGRLGGMVVRFFDEGRL